MKSLIWISGVACCAVMAGCGSADGPRSVDASSPSPPPIGFTFETNEGTLASIGWSGGFHNIKGSTDAAFGVKVTGCDNDLCQFEGPVAPMNKGDPISKVNRQRCLYQMNKSCTSDADCPATPNQPGCVYIYDAPISTPVVDKNGVPGACAWTYIALVGADHKPSIQGTLNLVSGELNLVKLPVLLELNSGGVGTGLFYGACPQCVGDSSPNDGIQGGTCKTSPLPDPMKGNADPGLSSNDRCDINRYGEFKGYTYGYSMDCAPQLAGTSQATPFGDSSFTSSAFHIMISDESPNCSNSQFSSEKCFCGSCPSGAACKSNRDCGGDPCVGPPLSTTDPSSIPTAGNLCVDDKCNWDQAMGVGTCTSRVPALGMINCYPSGLNTEIRIEGRAEVDRNLGTIYYASTASASCMPAGKLGSLNAQVGLPGLTFQKRNFRIIPVYPEGQP